MKSSNKKTLFLIALLILGSLIYSNTLTAPFVFDDHGTIESPRITALGNFLRFSGTRYLTDLTFALNYAAGGFNTLGYHIVNTLIHIANAVFVYLLISLLFETPALRGEKTDAGFIAAASSLLFLTHPIQTEAVTYISQRYASLAAFFYLLSIILCLRARLAIDGKKDSPGASALALYAGGIITTAAAQITKEISFTLPVMIALIEFTFFRNGMKPLRRLLYLLPVLLSLAIIPAILYLSKSAGAGGGVAGKLGVLMREDLSILPRYDYLITQFRVIVTYLRLLFIPIGQNVDYDYPVFHTLLSPQVLVSFIGLSIIFIGAVLLYIRSLAGKHPLGLAISFGVIWFFIAISVESSIIPISDVIFEHRLYLPGIGIMLSFSAFLSFMSKRLKMKKAAIAAVIVIAAANSFATFERNRVWGSEIALWRDVVKKSPNKARGYSNVGYALIKAGNTGEAVEYFGKAVRLKPEFWLTNYNMGNGLLQAGRPEDSLPFFYRTIKLKPDYANAYANLGYALVELKRPEQAVKYLAENARLQPDSADAFNNLGNALLLAGKTDAAISAYRRALELAPNDVGARTNLENALRQSGARQ